MTGRHRAEDRSQPVLGPTTRRIRSGEIPADSLIYVRRGEPATTSPSESWRMGSRWSRIYSLIKKGWSQTDD